MPTVALTRLVRDAPGLTAEAPDPLIASAGLTLDAVLGPVDLVVIERAHRGLAVELTFAEAAYLLGLLPEDLDMPPVGAEPTPADLRDARLRRARTLACCSKAVIRRAELLVTLVLLGAEFV